MQKYRPQPKYHGRDAHSAENPGGGQHIYPAGAGLHPGIVYAEEEIIRAVRKAVAENGMLREIFPLDVPLGCPGVKYAVRTLHTGLSVFP